MGPILVFGHKNPDNDSISSAVAYAHLKNLVDPDNVYVPARLGAVPKEAAWVFERFGVKLPEAISHVHTRVRDVMTESPACVQRDDTMLEAGRVMRERGVRGLPVVDESGRLVGLVNERILSERYLSETELLAFSDVPVTVAQIAAAVRGTVLVGDPEATIAGEVNIGAYEPATVAELTNPGDVLIVGDRVRTQPAAIEAGAACLIVCGGTAPALGVVELASQRGAAIVLTEQPVYAAVRLVGLAHAVGDFMDPDPLVVAPESLLSEVADEVLSGTHRSAVVAGDDRVPVGVMTRTDLARGFRRRVVLVDHNEMAQSAAGIESASVVEIVDHHRVGDIQTAGPVLFMNLPVGATATIVALRYRELGVEIPVPIAGVLLSAILTDTVLLKSPTTTPVDRDMVERLSAIVEVDPMEFGMDVFRSRSAGEDFSAAKVIGSDAKEFRIGEITALVAQYETVDLQPVMDNAEAVRAAMQHQLESRGYDLVLLMATDIVREGSQIMAVGKTRFAEKALGVSLAEDGAWMPGVLSRKKQVAARLVEAAGS